MRTAKREPRAQPGVMAPPEEQRLLLVGCGNMGRAILEGWIASGEIPLETITVVDPVAEALPCGVRLLRKAPATGDFSVIVLAVKPQLLDQVAPGLKRLAKRDVLLLSVLAGIEHARLERLFPRAIVVRFMANLAAAFGLSPVAVYAGELELLTSDRALVDHLLNPLGQPEWLDDECLLHAVTALGGSGPGFVYRFLAALAKGGEALGLAPGEAASMSLTMVRGAAELAARSRDDFATLAARVASPGGTTRAGLDVLERDGAIDKLIAATLRAAHDRSVDLGQE